MKLAKTPEEAARLAGQMLGMKLVTHQTGPEGRIVQRLLVEEALHIKKEYYLGIVIDRTAGKPVFMASAAGGMEIEEVAAKSPELILKEWIDPGIGFQAYQARKLAFGLGLAPELVNKAVQFMTALFQAFHSTDGSLAEINPFLLTEEGDFYALDAKINFDDNALFRHKEFASLRDLNEEDPLEVDASKYNLNYIKLDGNVGHARHQTDGSHPSAVFFRLSAQSCRSQKPQKTVPRIPGLPESARSTRAGPPPGP